MSSMSRKFYQSLAKRFLAARPSVHAQSYPMWVDMVVAATGAIAEGNPAFDRDRFWKACGMPDVEPALAGSVADQDHG